MVEIMIDLAAVSSKEMRQDDLADWTPGSGLTGRDAENLKSGEAESERNGRNVDAYCSFGHNSGHGR